MEYGIVRDRGLNAIWDLMQYAIARYRGLEAIWESMQYGVVRVSFSLVGSWGERNNLISVS